MVDYNGTLNVQYFISCLSHQSSPLIKDSKKIYSQKKLVYSIQITIAFI